jgi:hypothetical protein
MLVETVDVVTMNQGEMQAALIERVEHQTGTKVMKATLELVWDEKAPTVLRDLSHLLRGVRISGVIKRPATEAVPEDQRPKTELRLTARES